MKITDTPVVAFLTAVVSAFVMGGGGLIFLDNRIDRQVTNKVTEEVTEEVAKAKTELMSVRFTVSQDFLVVAGRAKDESKLIGGHKACFLTGSQDDNYEPHATAKCTVTYERGEWTLKARSGRCNAVCID
jgi:rRNA maturation protein Rpf1